MLITDVYEYLLTLNGKKMLENIVQIAFSMTRNQEFTELVMKLT